MVVSRMRNCQTSYWRCKTGGNKGMKKLPSQKFQQIQEDILFLLIAFLDGGQLLAASSRSIGTLVLVADAGDEISQTGISFVFVMGTINGQPGDILMSRLQVVGGHSHLMFSLDSFIRVVAFEDIRSVDSSLCTASLSGLFGQIVFFDAMDQRPVGLEVLQLFNGAGFEHITLALFLTVLASVGVAASSLSFLGISEREKFNIHDLKQTLVNGARELSCNELSASRTLRFIVQSQFHLVGC
mmetsp:Transcript_4363/g.4877  ORF Transcript_4363/g.4877 Transcript_4363/m.4877 type:complete len:241 (+) Transcript_4363:282-1004(+)